MTKEFSVVLKRLEIENRIFTIREVQVMIDRDLSEMYGVETKRLNEQVKRNIVRFPSEFCFQLSDGEKNELVANCDRFESLKHSSSLPYAFTEQGVAMLSAVLRSQTAVKVSIQIMNAFIALRKLIAKNGLLEQRLTNIERKQLETDEKFEHVFKALEQRNGVPDKGLFFDGQIFDAWKFASDLVRKAKYSIVLIDNYVDDTVLELFTKRRKGVQVTIYTKRISRQLAIDLEKHNAQYEAIIIKELKDAHDRFLILDDEELYHIGASLKDIGKKWFAFSKMDTEIITLLNQLNKRKMRE